jgi:hypothetical protein
VQKTALVPKTAPGGDVSCTPVVQKTAPPPVAKTAPKSLIGISKRTTKGTSNVFPLPENWQLSDDDIQAALNRGLCEEALQGEAEKFRAYWFDKHERGRPEARKTARGWCAAWRTTWCRNAVAFSSHGRTQRNGRSLAEGMMRAAGLNGGSLQ